MHCLTLIHDISSDLNTNSHYFTLSRLIKHSIAVYVKGRESASGDESCHESHEEGDESYRESHEGDEGDEEVRLRLVFGLGSRIVLAIIVFCSVFGIRRLYSSRA